MSTQDLKDSNELETKIRTLVGHDQIIVKLNRGHFLIQVLIDNLPETIARLSKIRSNLYGAAYLTHKGRWESLPGEGSLLDMAELIVDLLRPHFDISNF